MLGKKKKTAATLSPLYAHIYPPRRLHTSPRKEALRLRLQWRRPSFDLSHDGEGSSPPPPSPSSSQGLRRRLATHTALLTTTSLFRRPYPPFSTFNARPPSTSSRSFSSVPPAVRDQNSSSLGSQYYFRIIRDKFKDEQFARRALVVAAVVAWNFETVPYSSRWHLIQLTSGLERKLGEMAFEDTYEEGEALCSAFDGC